jgi:SWI/SNF-related matrix-associated actin-dependent regulator 1 of chromatin subfamily A
MKLTVVADPIDLIKAQPAKFISSLSERLEPFNPGVAHMLQKALSHEPEIKFPTIRELKAKADKLYQTHAKRIVESVYSVLSQTPAEEIQKSLGTWQGVPIIAYGPKGGKIVGYDGKGKPIYAGSKESEKLVQKKRKAPQAKTKAQIVAELESLPKYDDETALAKLKAIGDKLYDIQDSNPLEKDAQGLSSSTMAQWEAYGHTGDLNKIKSILMKHKNQIDPEEYHKLGLYKFKEEKAAATAPICKPYINSQWGSLMLPYSGKDLTWDQKMEIKDWQKSAFGAKFDGYKKEWYIPKTKLATFDAEAFVAGMEDKFGVIVEMPNLEALKDEAKQEKATEEENTANVLENATPQEALALLKSKKLKDTVLVIFDEESKTYRFYSTFSKTFHKIFSNKSGYGELSKITNNLGPEGDYAKETTDPELVEEAIERIKERMPEFMVQQYGVKEAKIAHAAVKAELQKPIPEVQAKLADGIELFPYQNEAVRFLDKTDGKALIGDEMGLGKTLETLAWLAKGDKKAIVVCPKVVRKNWLREATKFFPDQFKVHECIPSELKNGPPDLDGVNLVAMTYQSAKKYADILKDKGFDTIVVDESHRMKNPKAQQTKAIQKLGEGLPHKILLSGTAIKNKKEELVSQLDFIDEDKYTEWTTVTNPYSGAQTQKKLLKEKTTGGLWSALQDVYIARPKELVLKDLPEKTVKILEIEVPNAPDLKEDSAKELIDAYSELGEKELDAEDMDWAKNKSNTLADFMRVKFELAVAKAKHTAEYVKEHLASSDERVLVFTESREAADALKEELGDTAVLHHGQLADDLRQKHIDDFQEQDETGAFISKKKVFITTRQSAMEGITLTAASKVVFNDLPWTPADILQAEARVHRIGQKNVVNVDWITVEGNEFDTNVSAILKAKFDISKKVTKGQLLTAEEKAWMNAPLSMAELLQSMGGGEVGPAHDDTEAEPFDSPEPTPQPESVAPAVEAEPVLEPTPKPKPTQSLPLFLAKNGGKLRGHPTDDSKVAIKTKSKAALDEVMELYGLDGQVLEGKSNWILVTDRVAIEPYLKAFEKSFAFFVDEEEEDDYTVRITHPSGVTWADDLFKALYIGPKGGKWADPKRTIPWTPEHDKAVPKGLQKFLSERGGKVTPNKSGNGFVAKVPKEHGHALFKIKTQLHLEGEIIDGQRYAILPLNQSDSKKVTQSQAEIAAVVKQASIPESAPHPANIPAYATHAAAYKPAKTVEEANAYAKGFGIHTDYPSLAVGNACNKAISEQHPYVLQHVQFLGSENQLKQWAKNNPKENHISMNMAKHTHDLTKGGLLENAVAVAWPYTKKPYTKSVMVIDMSIWNDAGASASSVPGFSVSHSLGDVVRHEFGHIEGFVTRHSDAAESPWDKYKKEAVKLFQTEAGKAKIMNDVSQYAAKSPHELYAELSVLQRNPVKPVPKWAKQIIAKMGLNKAWKNPGE